MSPRKIKWGFLGCARISERALIPAIQKSKNGELFGVASRDFIKAQSWIEKYGFKKAYRGYDDLIADPDIDAIYNPLPNHLHCEWSCKAASAGKHILCEKPMAMNVTEVKKMIRETDKYDVKLMEAFMYRFHPQHQKVFQLIESDQIGEIRMIRSAFSFNIPRNYQDYRWDPKMGGGALFDVGCYSINVIRLMMGEEPLSVYAKAHYDPKKKIDLSFNILMEFSGNRTGVVFCSFESQFQSTYEILGNKGRITVPRAFTPKDRPGIIELLKGDNLRIISIPPKNQYTLMVEHFADCIFNNKLPRYPADDAMYNMRVINAAQKSAISGKTVKLPRVDRNWNG